MTAGAGMTPAAFFQWNLFFLRSIVSRGFFLKLIAAFVHRGRFADLIDQRLAVQRHLRIAAFNDGINCSPSHGARGDSTDELSLGRPACP